MNIEDLQKDYIYSLRNKSKGWYYQPATFAGVRDGKLYFTLYNDSNPELVEIEEICGLIDCPRYFTPEKKFVFWINHYLMADSSIQDNETTQRIKFRLKYFKLLYDKYDEARYSYDIK